MLIPLPNGLTELLCVPLNHKTLNSRSTGIMSSELEYKQTI